MHCNIILTYDNIMFTDFDNHVENRLSKRRLVGGEKAMYEYHFDFLNTIGEQCEYINLHRAFAPCKPYKFSFEEAFERVHYSKLRLMNGTTDGRVNLFVTRSLNDMIPPFNAFQNDKYIEQNSVDNKWHTMFMWGFHKLYNITDRYTVWSNYYNKYCGINKKAIRCAFSSVGDSTDITEIIIGRFPRIKSNINKYNLIKIEIQPNEELTLLWEIFNHYNGEVFPVKYSGKRLQCILAIPIGLNIESVKSELLNRWQIKVESYIVDTKSEV